MLLSFFIPLFFAFLAAATLTHFVRKKLLARAIMDVPNERSMHAVPVPRGGGLAVVMTVIMGMLVVFPDPFLLVALSLLGLISWLDDKKGMRASVRLGVHLLAALIGSFALGENAMLFGGALPLSLDRAIMILGWGWFMNLYNFMDGIDGITSIQTICCAIGVAVLLALIGGIGVTPEILLAALLIGGCGGFLLFNWHPAKIFLGDVGSVPLGFLIGFLLLRLAESGHLISALLIPLYYLADSGITIMRRALKGEKLWQAHRQHFYQCAAMGTQDPRPVVLRVLAANMGLALASYVAISYPWLGGLAGVLIVIFLLRWMNRCATMAPR